MIRILFIALLGLALVQGRQAPAKADLIIFNAHIYTMDSAGTVAQAMAISKGNVLATGSSAWIRQHYTASKTIDAQGKWIYPGFIDAHAHFYRYALGLATVDLRDTDSWDEVLARISKDTAGGKWVLGRGWDQNDWPVKEFPDNKGLDSLYPDKPVLLYRIDGHAVIANTVALKLAGVTENTLVEGGQVVLKDGKPSGVLVDNAVQLVTRVTEDPPAAIRSKLLAQAQQNCFRVGLTALADCGLDYQEALFMDSLQKKHDLRLRMYVMLGDKPENYTYLFRRGPYWTPSMSIRSFKLYADGALGSRGACLLREYSDQPGWKGFLLSSPEHFDSIARMLVGRGFQMCTHAIGDSANKMVLKTYAKYLTPHNKFRWRIEHAQVTGLGDRHWFGYYGIVPSVQPTHATSDMYWAKDRLGEDRMEEAYAYQSLLQQNHWLPLGTDFPVEDLSPLKTFYAAVFRKDLKGQPPGGFMQEEALTRDQALRGITIWAARANFQDKEQGSLEKGKYADFVVLDIDLMKASAERIISAKPLSTWIWGRQVY